MHLLPSEWAEWASDGNGDGVMSPDNMYDATIAAARKLCELARNVAGGDGTLATATSRQRVASRSIREWQRRTSSTRMRRARDDSPP